MEKVIHNPYKHTSPLDQKCILKAMMSYAAGGGMGFVMAAFMSAMEVRDFNINRDKRATRHVLKKDLRRMVGTAKSFAIFGGIIIFYECMIEHVRVKDDGVNTFLAGAATTMVLGASAMNRKELLYSGLGGGVMCYGFYKIFKMLGY